jgi:hypothetical protein
MQKGGKRMSHDAKCRELADYFLEPEVAEKDRIELADLIQETIEDWVKLQEILELER